MITLIHRESENNCFRCLIIDIYRDSNISLPFMMQLKLQRDNLIKFATRVPVFMYLTDFREATLKDVIELLEPELQDGVQVHQ